jgi:aspartate dehydrogenase
VDCVDFEALAERSDWVIECAPSKLLRAIAEPALKRGRRLVVLSAGALLDAPDLIELARERGGQIIVPTGALLGLDAVCAAREGTIHSVTLVTRKPIAGLLGAPLLVEQGIDISGLQEPMCLYRGNARGAAKGFPANVNVGVALSLAGIGADRTQVEVWADPTVTRNTHSIRVDADSASFSMTIENIPSENPKTGRITALSLIACLRKVHAPLRVGS